MNGWGKTEILQCFSTEMQLKAYQMLGAGTLHLDADHIHLVEQPDPGVYDHLEDKEVAAHEMANNVQNAATAGRCTT
eukprot:365817-Chlamydomonas_euryale.AAC.11